MSDHEIRLGDCLEGLRGLADKSVGATICDPPFSAHVHKRLGGEHRTDGTPAREALTFDCMSQDLAHEVAREVCRTTQRWALFFCDERIIHFWANAIEACGWLFVRGGIWLKTDAMPQMSGDRPSAATESIVIGHARDGGRLRWNGGGRRAVWECGIERTNREHPTQKPLALMEALVRDFTDPGELICDPFAGSGTTGVACKRLGRRFIGWERDPKFHAAAVKRLEATQQQYELLARGPKPKQARLLLDPEAA